MDKMKSVVTGEGNAPRITRTPWRQVTRDSIEATWNGLPVLISRVLSHNDRPTNKWNASVNGARVGRWGGTIKQCVQSIAKHIREISHPDFRPQDLDDGDTSERRSEEAA